MMSRKVKITKVMPGMLLYEPAHRAGVVAAVQGCFKTKLQLGELLFALQAPLNQEQQKKYWQLFESILRQYLGLRITETGNR